MALLTLFLAILSTADTQAKASDSYVCEFAGFAEVEDGELVDLQITELERE